MSNKRTMRRAAASASKKIQKSSAHTMLQPAASKAKLSRAYNKSNSAQTAKSMLKKPRRYNLVEARKLRRFRQSNAKSQQRLKKETAPVTSDKTERASTHQAKKKKQSPVRAASWSDDDLFSFGF